MAPEANLPPMVIMTKKGPHLMLIMDWSQKNPSKLFLKTTFNQSPCADTVFGPEGVC